MLNSCIYEGVIRHRRRTPAENSFKFSAFMFYLDLSEIESVFKRRWFWSTRKFAYASFQREDHLKQFPVDRDLSECVKDVLTEHQINDDIERICLLTQLRYFGFRMNPVSFYYCYRSGDQRLVAVVAEVNNTPWDEQHVYVIPDQDRNTRDAETPPGDTAVTERRTLNVAPRSTQRSVRTEKLDKSFHVSPFMHSDMYYRMIYSLPGERIGVKMENYDMSQKQNDSVDGMTHQDAQAVPADRKNACRKIFDVTMLMHKRRITSSRLFWMGIKYPCYSLKVFAGIYFQALKLYFKKVPFQPHPDRQTATN